MRRQMRLSALSLLIVGAGLLGLSREAYATGECGTCAEKPGCQTCGPGRCERGVSGEPWLTCNYACYGATCPAD